MVAEFTVKQSTDSVDLDDVISGHYDESSIIFNKPPEFMLRLPDLSGVKAEMLEDGKEIEIRRNGEHRFTGIIETSEPKTSTSGGFIELSGIHKGYKLIQRKICDSYDFDEDGDPATTRDAVTVNPWRYFVFRKAGGTIDSNGQQQPVDGVRPDEIMKCLIGTKFISQIDFFDNSMLLPSQIYATTNVVQVYRDGKTSDKRPVLQRVRDGANFLNGGNIESIPLENGDPNIDKMGTISTVEVKLIGELSGSDNPTIQVCRNARDIRTYTSITLTRTANYLSSGLSSWDGSVTLVGAETNKNSLGFKLTIQGIGGTTTTKIHYIKLTATTTSDTGIGEGTISTYVSPTIDGVDANERDWLETDVQGLDRLEAVERVRELTESSTSANSSPHWDAYIDSSLTLNFKERRGLDVTTHVYSFGNENLKEVSHEFYGGELAYQTIAYGAGSGIAQTRIVSKTAFTSGGLYDANRDPTSEGDGTNLYGNLPRVMQFVDSNETSSTALLRKARAFHKLHRDPMENVTVEIVAEAIRFFDVGDRIKIEEVKTKTNALFRVVELRRAWSGSSEEKLTVKLGEPIRDFADRLSETSTNTEIVSLRAQPADATTGLSGPGVYFDKDNFGVFSFGISDGRFIQRVLLKMNTLPWQATAKTAKAATGTTNPTNIYSDSGSSFSVSGSSTDNTTISDTSTVASTTIQDYDGFVFIIKFNSASGTKWRVSLEIRDQLNTWSGAETGGSNLIPELQEYPTGTGETSISIFFPFQYFIDRSITSLTGTRLAITNSNASSQTVDSASIDVFAVSKHVHPLTFGIFQFDGDSGDGTGNPVYGTGTQFAVDPTLNAQGLPSTFSTEKHPTSFGTQTTTQAIEFDVTGYMSTETNGIIKNGEHKVFFKGATDTNNTNGLSVVSVTPIIEFKEQSQ